MYMDRKRSPVLAVVLLLLLFALTLVIAAIAAGRSGAVAAAAPLSRSLLGSQTSVPHLSGPLPMSPTPAGRAPDPLGTPVPIDAEQGRPLQEAPITPAPLVQQLAPTPDPRALRLTEADSGARIELAGDRPLEIVLPANWSSGYRWELTQADENILRLTVQAQELDAPGRIGAPGQERLTFQAVGPGETSLRLAYRRPWEPAEPAQTFRVDVSTHEPFLPFTPFEAPSSPAPLQEAAEAELALPAQYNVCQQGGGCLPVEDQGQCGSCWSFAATGAVENELNIYHRAGVDGGEQYLVSCNEDGWSCGGGNPWDALDYFIDKAPAGEPAAGLVYETDAPYYALDLSCGGPYRHHEKIQSWGWVDHSTDIPAPALIKQAIYDHGPVVAAICAGTAMQNYSGGVFRTDESWQCGSGDVNHAILLVGWDNNTQTWILRNSWGAGWGESGTMRIGYGVSNVGYGAAYVVDAGSQSTPTTVPSQLPNLGPYQPSGWDYPVVPANVQGGNTVTTLYAGQPTYFDIAVANSGSTPAGPFDVCLYLDGAELNRWHADGLASGYYVWTGDWKHTVQTAGQHTVKLVADCGASVTETNEGDNNWQRTFTWVGTGPTPTPTSGAPRPNLLPYQPEGWDYAIVPANVAGGSSVTTLYANQPTYVDFAVANAGDVNSGWHEVCLYLDNAEIGRWESDGLPGWTYGYVLDQDYTVTTTGQHTLKVVADCSNAVTESNEGDNTYQRSFNWVSRPSTATPTATPTRPAGKLPDVLPYAPSGWDYPIVPANVPGGTHVTTLYAGQPTYIDLAIGNAGNAMTGFFYICLYLDGEEIGNWWDDELRAGYYDYMADVSYTIATPGQHALRLVVDCTGLLAESDESNNAFERTFTWVGTGPTPTPTATAVTHLPTPTPTPTRRPATATPTPTATTTPPPGSAAIKVQPASVTIPLSAVDAAVDIVIENAANVGAYQVDLAFNPAIVSVQEAKAGPFMGSSGRTVMPLSSIDNTAGLVTIGASTIGSQPGASGNGVLATLKLLPKAKGSTALDLQNLLLLKPNGILLPASTTDGQLTVSGCFGDFDGNGVVDIRDLQAASAHWNCRTGEGCYDAQYDVYPADHADGKIDISDIQRIAGAWNTRCSAQSSPAGEQLRMGAELHSPALPPLSLSLVPAGVAIGPGTVFTLTVGAQNAYNLGGFQTDVTFDPAKAQAITATVGPFLGSTGRSVSALGPVINNTSGRLTLGAFTFGANRAPSGTGDLAYIRLRALAAGVTLVDFAQPSVTDPLGNPVQLGDVRGSTVLIGGRRTYVPILLKR